MERRLIVEFSKMSGAGNDFIVIDNRFYNFAAGELSSLARRQCVRRHGIGADGLLALQAPRTTGTAFSMVYFNADGSEGTMCANGARCLARFAVSAGLPAGEVQFDTSSGSCTAKVTAVAGEQVRVYMGWSADWCASFELSESLPEPVQHAHYVWTGTEHLVCFVASLEDVCVAAWGKALRNDAALAPRGANINFVHVTSASSVSVRTYEKGVEAETLACGTGALASAVAARYLGLLDARVAQVAMPGGTLQVGVTEPYFVEGPAETVYRGSFEY